MDSSKNIAIQGVNGAFHEIAARNYFDGNNIIINPKDSFEDVIEFVEHNSKQNAALMAIENTIAGSLLGNYQLLVNANVEIIGEVYLRIRHNLMALPGQTIADLKEVHSHPVALAQCKMFFRNYPHIKLVESIDTAKSALDIQTNKKTKIGAVASNLAANIYDMEILAKGIETNKTNYTRFLVLDHKSKERSLNQHEKISVSFSITHEVGSLYDIIGVLKHFQANMTKIQSVPLLGSQWQYIFFIDFILEDYTLYDPIIKVLKTQTKDLKVLGRYKSGLYYES